MTNPYINYYVKQAGSGLAGFEGARIQKGHGFFGNIWSSALKPLARYLGKNLLGIGKNVAQEYFTKSKPIKEALTEGLEVGSQSLLKDAFGKIKEKINKPKEQKGEGFRKRRRTRSTQCNIKRTRKAKKKPVKKRRSRSKQLWP